MLNQVILVGRISKEVVKNGERYEMGIAIPRSFKNADGEYETDFVDITLYNQVGESTMEYCKKGDIVGIKGRVQNGELNKPLEIIAEKVTFLSSKGN